MDIQASFVLESKCLELEGKKDSGGEQEPLVPDRAVSSGQEGVLGAKGLMSLAVYCLLVKCLLLSQCELGKTGISLTTNN